jgi:hypothetical protein
MFFAQNKVRLGRVSVSNTQVPISVLIDIAASRLSAIIAERISLTLLDLNQLLKEVNGFLQVLNRVTFEVAALNVLSSRALKVIETQAIDAIPVFFAAVLVVITADLFIIRAHAA